MMTDTTLPPRDDMPQPPPPPYMPPPTFGAPPPPLAAPQYRRGPSGWTILIAAVVMSAVVSAATTAAITRRSQDESTVAAHQVTRADDPVDTTAGRGTGPDTAAASGDVARVAAAVSPSVVHIAVAGLGGSGTGSGVVLREDGHILTNAHVVDGAAEVQVTLPDGSIHRAEVVGADPSSDLAVVRADDAQDLPVPHFSETAPRVGDLAVALGSPFGLEGSVTSGIISALNRSVPGDSGMVINMLQTDAAINPGNSGGALANGDGEIIGINTAIISSSQGNDGIGFAIPISTALPVADQLIEHGFAEHAQLGIQGQDVDPEAADLYNLGVERGALVVTIGEGTAAEDAGLRRGDIITAMDDQPVTSMADLAGQITSHAPGDEVMLEVMRDGETLTIDVTLGSAPRQ
jgi:S1-C subfamily serine protease